MEPVFTGYDSNILLYDYLTTFMTLLLYVSKFLTVV